MSWYLRKEWTDQDAGIDAVVIHFGWSALGRPANFSASHRSRELQDWGNGRRGKVLAMPRSVWDEEWGWCSEYAMHYGFEVIQGENRWTTEMFTEEIASRELEYVDDSGYITNICLHWAVGDWSAPTYSPMEDERFPADSEFASMRYYGYWDKPRYHHAKWEMLRDLPLPHRWRARIWGPRGSTVLQQYHIGHMFPEDEQTEFFLGPDGATGEFGSSWAHEM